jgi:sirohydrochlorin ferrochelatase
VNIPASLVLAAHGTGDPAGIAELDRLASLVALRLPGVAVRVGYVDVLGPSVAAVLSEVDGPVTLVPLFLANGYHVRADIPAAVADAGRRDITVTPALGPDPALVDVALDRLRAAGAHPAAGSLVGGCSASGSLVGGCSADGSLVGGCSASGSLVGGHSASGSLVGGHSADGHLVRAHPTGAYPADAVVLAAAGSADPRAIADVQSAARLLGAPAGFIATSSPPVADVVRSLRARQGVGRVAIASWLLAPGFFHARLAGAGADIVAEPLGAHPAVADLIVRRANVPLLTGCGQALGEP